MPEDMNFEDDIPKLLDRSPFFPFFISLTSGERFEVSERHQLAIGKGNTVVILHPRTGMVFFRKNQIVAIDAPEPAM